MKKTIFKKILSMIDIIELQGIQLKDLEKVIQKELTKENIISKEFDLSKTLPYLFNLKFVKDVSNKIDLSPCATIFSKADANSQVEALSLFECLYQNIKLRPMLAKLIHQSIHKVDLFTHFNEISYSLLMQTSLFIQKQDMLSIRANYLHNLQQIEKSYEGKNPLISVSLCALYTASIVSHEDPRIEYRNQNNELVNYENPKIILDIIPRRGVPNDRNETKALQIFYKDTLFHECAHQCPICGIDFPHLLIASHIKPFRDCAHLYEAIDHNNGLLLCRNHDYLFDQGYFSFDSDGKILFSKELKEKKNTFAYAMDESFHLKDELLTRERTLFLTYHREHIFKS